MALIANSIWKSFLKYEIFDGNSNLQFPGHQLYFRKHFQLQLILNKQIQRIYVPAKIF